MRSDRWADPSLPPRTLSAVLSGTMHPTKSLKALVGGVVALSTTLVLVSAAGGATRGLHAEKAAAGPVGDAPALAMRVLPSPLYGVTVDDVTNLGAIVAGARALEHMPVTRVYFNVKEPASHYAAAVRAIQPVSYVMGELLDSSDSRRIGTAAYGRRASSRTWHNSATRWTCGRSATR